MLQYKIPTIKNILHSIPIGSIMVLLLLLGFLISPNIYYSNNSVYAVEEENIEDNVTGNPEEVADDSNISTQANVTTASATLSIDNSANGTSYSEPGETIYRTHNVDVHVNDVTSYNLSISYGADANNTLNYEGSSKNPPTITGANNLAGNSLENNTWGYYWDTNNTVDTSTLNYSTMPNYNASETILTESNSNNIAYNKTINGKLIFAAKFAEDAPYGHYKTSVLLSLAATPQNITTYSITYNCNGGSNCPANHSQNSTNLNYTYTIPSTKPTRANYTFLGYNTSSTATTANANYAPGKTITLASSSPNLTLYAVWKQDGPSVTGFSSIRKMQNMTSAICNSVSIGVTGQLYDTRDNSTYTVAKLDDGKCWMTQNLRIVNKKISSADSNVSSDYTIPASGDPWDSSIGNNASRVYYYNDTTNGAYYTWCAAAAGDCNISYAVASSSICPRGWRLPTLNEYNTLASRKSGSWNRGWTLAGGFFPAAGEMYNGSIINVSVAGRYWSSMANASYDAYALYFSDGNASTLARNRFIGNSVRCIAQ